MSATAIEPYTVMGWDWLVRPKGWMRLLGPLFGPLGGLMERRIWAGLSSSSKPAEALAPPDPFPTPCNRPCDRARAKQEYTIGGS
jgi:hypothetical protein